MAAPACSVVDEGPETPPASPHSSGNTPQPSSPIEATTPRILHIPSDPSANSSSVSPLAKFSPGEPQAFQQSAGLAQVAIGLRSVVPRTLVVPWPGNSLRLARHRGAGAWELPLSTCSTAKPMLHRSPASESVNPPEIRRSELEFTGYSFQQCVCQQKEGYLALLSYSLLKSTSCGP